MDRAIYAVILAGGSGTRFWPLSRNSLPKQLMRLFHDRSLIQQTVHRLEGLVPRENIIVLTNVEQIERTREALPDLPPGNIVAEPCKRDTAPAVALGIGLVARRDPEAVMIILPADQLIQDIPSFQAVMRSACHAASQTTGLVTIGVKPTWACPSYGYVERALAAEIPGVPGEHTVFHVQRFREKPNPELAEEFLRAGNFSWNAGMFIWSVPTARAELRTHAPELAEFIGVLECASDIDSILSERFAALHKTSVDYALMEKAETVYNIEATFDWDDIGSWLSVAKYFPSDDSENQTNCECTAANARKNIVFSREGTHIALLGVEDLIVVQTKDALLIAHRGEAEKIKALVDQLPSQLQ